MFRARTVRIVASIGAFFCLGAVRGAASDPLPEPAARRVASGIADPWLRELALAALHEHPRLGASHARGLAADAEASRAGALPDPALELTGYLSSPETRVGSQRLTAKLMQPVPWFGKRGLRAQAAEHGADAHHAMAEAEALGLVTELRRLHYEIAFADAEAGLIRSERDTLGRYEELARARYASGKGTGQAVTRIQAEITRADARTLAIAERRTSLSSTLLASAAHTGPETAVPTATLPEGEATLAPEADLIAVAHRFRPELRAAVAQIARGDSLVALAGKEGGPDLHFGFTYTAITRRDDTAGMLLPDNGRDSFGVMATFELPFNRSRVRSAVEEASQLRLAAVGERQDRIVAIDAQVREHRQRFELADRRVTLLQQALMVQAEESLRQAEASYTSAMIDAFDLLDAERMLFDVRVALMRSRTDRAIALARLEGAVGRSLEGEEVAR